MKPWKTFYAFAWKDGRILAPLWIILVVLALMVSLAAATQLIGSELLPTLVLIPNIMALGAAALLVGNEEEQGTLQWLRSFPISWQEISVAKLGLAIVAWSTLCAICALLALLFTQFQVDPRATSMTRGLTIAYFTAFSLDLLACGFVCAWGVRSAFVGVLLVVPMISLITVLVMALSNYYERMWFPGESDAQFLAGAFLHCVAAMFNLLLGIVLARRRWLGKSIPWQNLVLKAKPVYWIAHELLPLQRPSIARALLWQSGRQSFRGLAILTGMMAVGVGLALVMYVLALPNRNDPKLQFGYMVLDGVMTLSNFLIVGSAIFLGALVFTADNSQRRALFLADRGVSPRSIWWTRQFWPLSILGIATLVRWLIPLPFGWLWPADYDPSIVSVILVAMGGGYALSQFAGFVTHRPMVGLLASLPVYFVGYCWTAFFSLWSFYIEYSFVITFSMGVLLLATRQETRKWMELNRDWRFNFRMTVYLLLAFFVIPVSIYTIRWATMSSALSPKQLRQLNQRTAQVLSQWPKLSEPMPFLAPNVSTKLISFNAANSASDRAPWLYEFPRVIDVKLLKSIEHHLDWLNQGAPNFDGWIHEFDDMARPSLSDIYFADLEFLGNLRDILSQHPEMKRPETLLTACEFADKLDSMIANYARSMHLSIARADEIIRRLPSKNDRLLRRLRWFCAAWQSTAYLKRKPTSSKQFNDFAYYGPFRELESKRRFRLIDRAFQVTIFQLDHALLSDKPTSFEESENAWQAVSADFRNYDLPEIVQRQVSAWKTE